MFRGTDGQHGRLTARLSINCGWALMTGRPRIIILDDDASMLGALTRVLRIHGFEAETFGSVQDFLAGAHFGGARCLILDVDLGGGSGIELRKQLASQGVSAPVIFITAIDSESLRAEALQAGCVACLSKPFASSDLIDALEQVA